MGLVTTLQNIDIYSWLPLLAVAVPLLLIGQVIYNLYFHPLAHVPGPFWARVSGIPSWLQARSGKRHIWLDEQFRIHNTDKLRVEPNSVVFRHPEAYRAIYGMESNVKRSEFYRMWSRNSKDVNTTNTIEPAEHQKRRKILNRCFTDKSLRAAAAFIITHMDRWHEIVIGDTPAGEWSSPIDLAESLDTLIIDILTDLCFGRSAQIKEPGPNPLKSIPHCIAEYLKLFYPLCRSPFRGLLVWLKPRGLDAVAAHITPPAIKQYNDFVHQSVTARLALHEAAVKSKSSSSAADGQDVERQDMFHFLISTPSNLPDLTLSDLLAESHLLIVAGSDSTSVVLSGLYFYLTLPSNQHVLARLTAEIRSTFDSLDEIVYPSPKLMSACPYLKVCIDEALRLVTPGMGELPREVLPGGMSIQGEHYPAGTVVGTSPYVMAVSEEIWGPDAKKYRPERWILLDQHPDSSKSNTAAAADKEQLARMRAAFHPFLSGPTNCAGKTLALSEMYMAVARTLYRFDVRRVPGSTKGMSKWGDDNDDPETFGLWDAFIALREGPEVQFRTRSV